MRFAQGLWVLAVTGLPRPATAAGLGPGAEFEGGLGKEERPVEVPKPPPPLRPAPRLRFGIAGGGLVGGNASLGPESPPAFVIGAATFQLDLGVQLHRSFAVYPRLELSSSVVFNQAMLAVIADYTPIPRFSIGAGIGYDAMVYLQDIGGCGADGACLTPSWGGFSAPLHLALNFRQDAEFAADTRRSVLRIQLEVAPGIQVGDGRLGMHGALTIGRSWM